MPIFRGMYKVALKIEYRKDWFSMLKSMEMQTKDFAIWYLGIKPKEAISKDEVMMLKENIDKSLFEFQNYLDGAVNSNFKADKETIKSIRMMYDATFKFLVK